MIDMERIRRLLQDERAALRAGEVEALGRVADEKAALLAAVSTEEADPDTLAELRDLVERNQSLLDAARRGLGAALTQIGAAKAATVPQTYGPNGERDSLGPAAKRFEKRC
ncbi:MAG: hypothetical protein AAF762_03045 [Pseudomonadota bacterium]